MIPLERRLDEEFGSVERECGVIETYQDIIANANLVLFHVEGGSEASLRAQQALTDQIPIYRKLWTAKSLLVQMSVYTPEGVFGFQGPEMGNIQRTLSSCSVQEIKLRLLVALNDVAEIRIAPSVSYGMMIYAQRTAVRLPHPFSTHSERMGELLDGLHQTRYETENITNVVTYLLALKEG